MAAIESTLDAALASSQRRKERLGEELDDLDRKRAHVKAKIAKEEEDFKEVRGSNDKHQTWP